MFTLDEDFFLYLFLHTKKHGTLNTQLEESLHFNFEKNYMSLADIWNNGHAVLNLSVIDKIAYIYVELNKQHFLPDGNKQFAFFFLAFMLDTLKIQLAATDMEYIHLGIHTVMDNWDYRKVSQWITNHISE